MFPTPIQKVSLKENQIYSEAVKNMLQDTGIKTKVIKQYLLDKFKYTYI